MGKKYIIELEEEPFVSSEPGEYKKLYRVKGFNSLVFDENGLSKLTPYEEEAKAQYQTQYDFPRMLEYALDRKGMTQRDLAMAIGKTEVSVSRYVSGSRVPKAPTIAAMARVLGVSTDYLLGLEDE